MPSANAFEIVLSDPTMTVVVASNLIFFRLHDHPSPWHFRTGERIFEQRLKANQGPMGGMLVVPRDQKTLPPMRVLQTFATLLRTYASDVAVGVAVIEPEVGAMGAVIRVAVATQLLVFGAGAHRIFDSTFHAARWLSDKTPAGALPPVPSALALAMARATDTRPRPAAGARSG